MDHHQSPPLPESRDRRNPTLLFTWWVTIFSAVIIIIRLCARKTRSDRLFREDWIIMISLIPLFIRMAFIHVVLIWGTNNVQTVGIHYTEVEIQQRSIGSRLVLAARIFYALYIWTCKLAISEFLKRITIRIWRKSYEWTLRGIRVFLVITFFLVIIGTLSECQPFDHYWQVVPNPGPQCRQGYGNLITMGTCDTITDILLVAFPIPIIARSGSTWRRKLQLSSLFSLSLIPIGITIARVVLVVHHGGKQQYRTAWASCEILAATAVSNAVIIGSILRDKGTKKNKYRRSPSVSDSVERSSARRPTITALQNTGSDENLFRFLGIRVPDHLQEEVEDGPRLAPAALPAKSPSRPNDSLPRIADGAARELGGSSSSESSDESLRKLPIPLHTTASPPPPTSRRGPTFFDVGGLLDDRTQPHRDARSRSRSRSRASSPSPGRGNTAATTNTHDFAPSTPNQSRRGSHAFLQDIGGLLTPTSPHNRPNGNADRFHHGGGGRRQSDSHLFPPSRHNRPAPTGVLGPMLERRETQQSLQDAGGLLLADIPEIQHQQQISSYRRAFSDAHDLLSRARDGEEQELQELHFSDAGGLLSASHQPDASAAALERAMARGRSPQQMHLADFLAASRQDHLPHAAPPQRAPPPGSAAAWESMNFGDAGGLLGR